MVLVLLFAVCDRHTGSPLWFWKYPVTWSVANSNEVISSISIWVYCFSFFFFLFLVIFWCSRTNLSFHVEWTSPETPNYILSPEIYFSQAKCKKFFPIFHILSNRPQLHLFLIANCDTLLCYFSKQSNFLETLNKGYYETKIL